LTEHLFLNIFDDYLMEGRKKRIRDKKGSFLFYMGK
jgi:hypothetical protein